MHNNLPLRFGYFTSISKRKERKEESENLSIPFLLEAYHVLHALQFFQVFFSAIDQRSLFSYHLASPSVFCIASETSSDLILQLSLHLSVCPTEIRNLYFKYYNEMST